MVIKNGVKIKENSIIKSFSYLEDVVLEKIVLLTSQELDRRLTLEITLKLKLVEIKKSKLYKGVKVNHLSYIVINIGKNSNIVQEPLHVTTMEKINYLVK